MPPEVQAVREWLTKARHDLRVAELALGDNPPVLDLACFHCQQAAEKALKAFLQWHQVATPRVHALGALLDSCRPLQPNFDALRPDLLALSYYAVAVRYPSAKEPDRRDAEQALATAKSLLAIVLQSLPPEVQA
jgi:HEPN domain-containing protein